MLTQHRIMYPARLPLPTIILRSANISRVYNNANLTNENTPVEVIGDINDAITYNFTGTQKLIGSSDNSFTYSFANSENYNVITEFGTLSVTEDTPTEIIPDNLIIYTGSSSNKTPLGVSAYCAIYAKNPYSERKTATFTSENASDWFSSTSKTIYSDSTNSVTLYHNIIEGDIIAGSYTTTVYCTIGNLTKSVNVTLIPENIRISLSSSKLEISSIADGYDAYYLGQAIEYKISLINNGNVTLHNIEIYDIDGTTIVETVSQLSQGQCYETTNIFTHIVTNEDIENVTYVPNHHIISNESSYGISSINITTNFIFSTTEKDPPSKIVVNYIDYVEPRNIFGHVLNETVYYRVNVTNNDDEQEIIVTGTDPTSTYDLPSKTSSYDFSYYTIKNNDVQDGYATLIGDYSAEYENNEPLDSDDIRINSINVCAANTSNFGNITMNSITFNGYSYNNVAMTEGQIYNYITDYPYYDAYISDNGIDYYTSYSADYETFENGGYYRIDDENSVNNKGYLYYLHEVSVETGESYTVKTIWSNSKQEYFVVDDASGFEGGGSSSLHIDSGSFIIKNVWCNIANRNSDIFSMYDGLNVFPSVYFTLYDIDGNSNEYYAEFDTTEIHNKYGSDPYINDSDTFYSYSKIYDSTTEKDANIGMILLRTYIEYDESGYGGYLVTMDLKWNPCAAEFE